MKIVQDEKTKFLIKEYTVCTVATILLMCLVGTILEGVKNYNLCPTYVLYIFNGIMTLLIMFYVMPTIMIARYRTHSKNTKKPVELPSVKYCTDKNGIPEAIKFNNSDETKLQIVIFEDSANVYANNSELGTSIFAGNANMCLREISNNWNKCKEYTMTIGSIPVNSNGDDIKSDKIYHYHTFNLTLAESTAEKMMNQNKSSDSKE